MIFTANQVRKLIDIVERFHTTFIATNVGTQSLSLDEKNLLRRHGIDVNKLPKEGVVDKAFKFGLIAEALGDERAKKMNYKTFEGFLSSGKFIPLTKLENLALDNLKYQMYSDIKSLGTRVSRDLSNMVIEGTKQNTIGIGEVIEETGREAIKNRAGVKQLASMIGERTQSWVKDFDRTADYVLHEAFDRGKAQYILQNEGEDALVYKEVYSGACKYCQGFYLTAGIGSPPVVFKLSTLMNNGTNIGRKQAEWKPVIGSTHPWCRCELHDVPKGFKWNPKDQAFTTPVRDTKGVKRQSRAKITVT